jgi:putative transposase
MVNDPAHYRWSSYRANGLGQADPLLTPHEVYLSLGRSDADRMEAYRALFRSELDADALGDIRKALDQGQPLGNSRSLDSIERATGQRREAKPRGRPRKQLAESDGTEERLLIEI